MSTPPSNPTLEELDQMYADATAACQRIWNAINDARQNGCNIEVSILSGNVVVQAVKGQQLVWIDAASTVNYNSVIKSATPAETQINPS
ncbi:MAG: hypothetical protein P4L77_10590 [Sulfuriferula sp.]|nr:hypothetical protein [Sulfuriferula sp.]